MKIACAASAVWMCLSGRRLTCSFFVLSDPVYEDLLSESRKMITNEKIDAYNEAAVRILNSSSRNSKAKVKVFSVSKLIAQETIMKSADGLHLPESSRDTVSAFVTAQHEKAMTANKIEVNVLEWQAR